MKNDFVLVTSGSLDGVNGVVSFIKNLNLYLKDNPHYRGIFSYARTKKTAEFKLKHDIENSNLADNDISCTKYRRPSILMKFKDILIKVPLVAFFWLCITYFRPARKVAKKIISSSSSNVTIISNDMFLSFFLPASKFNLITIFHSSDNPINQLLIYFPSLKGGWGERLLMKMFYRAVDNSDAIVTLNVSLANKLKIYDSQKNIHVIPNGVPEIENIQTKKEQGEKLKLVGVGSLTKRKGFDLLVEAFSRSSFLRNHLELDIFGDGPEFTTIEKDILLNGLSNTIKLNGNVNDVSSKLISYDLFILPSRDEGLPIAILEACSNKVPIASTRVGAIPEVFSENEIVYFEPTVESVTNTLERIVKKEIDLSIYNNRAYLKFRSELSIDAMWNKYITVLLEVENSCYDNHIFLK